MPGRKLPSLNGLRAFEAFARLGAMTRAAEELCVTHGAVSRQVRDLQVQLGAQLVEGPKTRLSVTPAGETLAAALTEAFGRMAAALPPRAEQTGDELVISCAGTLAMKWLIPRLPALHAEHPHIHIRISESQGPWDYGADEAHAAIRLDLDVSPDTFLQITPLMSHAMGLVSSPTLLQQARDDMASIVSLPRLRARSHLASWIEWAELSGVSLPAAAKVRDFDHFHNMVEAAAAGLGVAAAPWAFVAPDIASGRLVAPFGFAPSPARFVYLRPRRTAHRWSETFGDWLVRQAAKTLEPKLD
jgi:DNA-binding transcriptional LysR family regulator